MKPTRSSIEIMIDKACGFVWTPQEKGKPMTVRCPVCRKELESTAEDGDPEGATVCETPCPICIEGPDIEGHLRFLDNDGNEMQSDKSF